MPRSFTVASLVVAALSAIQVQAQPSTNATCTDQLWSFNSLQQSPCLVAAYLSAPCTNDNTWTVLAVNGGYYAPPTKERANTCQCNTVTWNLLSACSMCQGGTTGSWTEWITNCTNPAVGKYVLPIPSNVTVPHWAYYDFTATGVFNAVIASQQSGPESSAIPSMTSTGSVTGTSTPSASSTSSSDKSTNTGAIAGGVVGAVLGLSLIALIAFVLVRRSRQGSRADSATPMVGQYQPGFQSAGTTSHSGSKYVFKPYDPNDPSTFPPGLDDTTAPGSYTDSLPHTNQSHARPGHYTGAAHV